jgi:DNA repair protein RecO (recombination protein O)
MPSAAEIRDGFALTGFFLVRHVYEPRGESLPESRYHFIAAAVRGGP